MKQMKRNIVLEQIIRKALLENEGANITVETAVLNTREDAEMDALHKLVLAPAKIPDITYDKADGISIMITRSFGRGKDKKFYLSPTDLKKYAILKLDSLSAGLQAKTSTDYVWILDMQDTKLDKRDKPKEKRIFATYRFPAFYINKSLISNAVTSTMSGYIQTIGRGAMLFDRAKLKDSEWKRLGSIVTDDPSKEDNTTIVKTELELKSNSSDVPKLFKYFFTNIANSAVIDNISSVKNSNIFGCELRGACEQFQIEQSLPVTGKWDDASIAKANELYTKEIPLRNPQSAPPPEYTFINTDQLKERIAACKLDQSVFKFNETKDDPGLLIVQQMMLKFLEKNGISKAPTDNANRIRYENLKTMISGGLPPAGNGGTYNEATKLVVSVVMNVLQQLNVSINNINSEQIDNNLIKLIK